MAPAPTAAEVARGVADTLDRHGLPYAIGGALALAYYAVPRATVDVDLNVFVKPDTGFERILTALNDAGFAADADPQSARQQAIAEGQFRGRIDRMRVDVFVPAIEYYASLETRRRQVELLERPIWILGPEDLVILKLMFFRRKDLADVEAVLRDQIGSLDLQFIRTTLVGMVGADDPRLHALSEIEADVAKG